MTRDALTSRLALLLFGFACLLYAGTAKGVLEQVDDVAMLRVTQAIVHTGGVAVPPDTPGAMPGADGRFYTRYGLGLSLLAIPFYAIGSLFPADVATQALYDPHGYVTSGPVAASVTAVGLLATAASVALLYLTCRALGFGHVGSVAAALALGVATFAWHYARTFLSEPPSMLAALLAMYGLVRFSATRGLGWAAVSGAAAGAAVLLRVGNAVLLVPLGAWLVWLAVRRGPGQALPALGTWLVPVTAFGAVVAVYNLARFGTVLETGYADQAQAFGTPLYVGLYGLWLSSGKGVPIYAPVVLAGIVGWWTCVRLKRPDVGLTLAAMVALYSVLYARFEWWYGGGPWGPRFMVVVLPFLCIGIAALFERRRGLGAWLVLATLALISTGIQVLSVAVPYLRYEAPSVQDPVAFDRMIWHPAYSPVMVHYRSLLAGDYPLDFAFSYYPYAWVGWFQVACLLVAAVVLIGIVASLRGGRRTMGRREVNAPHPG